MKGVGPASVGKWGERVAASFLKLKGYEILQRNYHFGHKEIDIVARCGRELVFVEVKVRCRGDFGGPLAAVGWRKRRELARAAAGYLARSGAEEPPCRFDVVGIEIGPEGRWVKIEHVERAFEG